MIKKIFTVAFMACSFAYAIGAENEESKVVKPEAWGDVEMVTYPKTVATFYGSGVDVTRKWNICTGSTDGGVVVNMKQEILPIQNCPGDYVVVRRYTYPDGTLIKQSLQRLSNGSVPI